MGQFALCKLSCPLSFCVVCSRTCIIDFKIIHSETAVLKFYLWSDTRVVCTLKIQVDRWIFDFYSEAVLNWQSIVSDVTCHAGISSSAVSSAQTCVCPAVWAGSKNLWECLTKWAACTTQGFIQWTTEMAKARLPQMPFDLKKKKSCLIFSLTLLKLISVII